jgi:outer membrane protein assembly factor BamB
MNTINLKLSRSTARRQSALVAVLLWTVSLCSASDPASVAVDKPHQWPAFLGSGATPLNEETLPLTWDAEKNIAWKATIPGKGQSSPVIYGDLVVATSIEGAMKEKSHVCAYDLSSGVARWTHSFDASSPVRSNYFQSRSASTPAIDARGVYAFFETGDVVAVSHEGRELWRRSLTDDYGDFEGAIGLAASPVQTDAHIILLIDHEGPSYLIAFEKASGRTVWKTDRFSRVSYSSPQLVTANGTTQIVCSSSGSVDGYDATSGKLLWTTEDVGGNRACSPVPFGDGRFLIGASPGMHGENEVEAGKSNLAMQIVPTSDGFASEVIWRADKAMPSFGSPMVHRNCAYWITRPGVIYCLNAETGEPHYIKRGAQHQWATPLGVGDRVYCFGKDGVTTVLAAGPEFKIIAENALWAQLTDTPQPGGSQSGGSQPGGAAERAKPESVQAKNSAQPQVVTQPQEAAVSKAGTSSPTPKAGEKQQVTDPDSSHDRSNHGAGAEAHRGQDDSRRPVSKEQAERLRALGTLNGQVFADPVQYGYAVVNGTIVIRTGDTLYAIRDQQ